MNERMHEFSTSSTAETCQWSSLSCCDSGMVVVQVKIVDHGEQCDGGGTNIVNGMGKIRDHVSGI